MGCDHTDVSETDQVPSIEAGPVSLVPRCDHLPQEDDCT